MTLLSGNFKILEKILFYLVPGPSLILVSYIDRELWHVSGMLLHVWAINPVIGVVVTNECLLKLKIRWNS